MSDISKMWPLILQNFFPFKTENVQQDWCRGNWAFYLPLCTVHFHTGQHNLLLWEHLYPFAVCPPRLQEAFPHKMQRQLIWSQSSGGVSKLTLVNVSALVHVSAHEWNQCGACTATKSLGRRRCSHLCQGAWRLCPRLTYAWIHIYWPTLRWLKTWLLISRQLYQDSNGQTISLTGREQKEEERHRKDGRAWMILIVMAISAVFFPSEPWSKGFSSPPPIPAHYIYSPAQYISFHYFQRVAYVHTSSHF